MLRAGRDYEIYIASSEASIVERDAGGLKRELCLIDKASLGRSGRRGTIISGLRMPVFSITCR